MKFICLILQGVLHGFFCFAQKQEITPEIAQKWGRVQFKSITDDGKYLLYNISSYPKTKDDKLVIQSTFLKWKIELKDVQIPFEFTGDSRKVIGRNAGDSLFLITLGANYIEYIPNVKSFNIPKCDKGKWLVYQLKNFSNTLVLKNLKGEKEWRFDNIDDYRIDDNGNNLIICRKYVDNKQKVVWIDLKNNLMEHIVWVGVPIHGYIFNHDFTKLAFLTNEENSQSTNVIWLYKKGDKKALKIADDNCAEFEDKFTIGKLTQFSKKENGIIFSLKEKNRRQPRNDKVNVNIWSYTDPKLQSNQLWSLKPYSFFNPEPMRRTLVRLSDHKIIRMEQENDKLIGEVGDYALLFCKGDGDMLGEWNWNATALTSVEIINIIKGTREKVFDRLSKNYYSDNNFSLSPDEKYIFYFDLQKQNYFNYSISTGVIKCLTCSIQTNWTSYLHRDEPDAAHRPLETAGFINNGKDILIYSQNDIYQVAVSGNTLPINLTGDYGKKNNMVFRLLFPNEEIKSGDRLILNAFDRNNINNGYFSLIVGKKAEPTLLTMQPCMFTGPDESASGDNELAQKAKNSNVYLVTRQKASESPNLFVTRDFKNFAAVSKYYPEKEYHWLTAELHKWKGLNGDTIKGILYKPEKFDPNKKYPVIFYYYERLSEGLHRFLRPEYSGGVLNIPYFVTHDYLVFIPDIPKIMGHPGPSAVNGVVSAANYLSDFPWIDSSKIGLQGHSFGGFETNYLITHSNKFAAAVSAAGMSDFVSVYNSINPLGDGNCRQKQFEIYHDAIGASLWERPDFYIENTPVLYAQKVTTPILMMNNKEDGDVPFSQGVEFFTALRRLGKRVWMLQYDDQDHILLNETACKDFTIRMLQFFDHYLKDKPAPIWMTRGIPSKDKGIKDGLEYDTEIKTPGEGLLLPEEKQKIDSFKYRKPFTITIP